MTKEITIYDLAKELNLSPAHLPQADFCSPEESCNEFAQDAKSLFIALKPIQIEIYVNILLVI